MIDIDLISMTKDSLINMLTRFDTSCYRKNGLVEFGKYKHEPPKFRVRLKQVYNKLEKDDIVELLKIRLDK